MESKTITKFKLRGYNPKKIPDIQLRDDWRLVVAKYATMRRGGKTEFANLDEVLAFGERVLRELISRFDAFTIHYENYRSPESREFLIRLLKRIVKKGLLLVEPHARWIWEGKKSLMVKKKKFDLLEPRWLVSTEGTVYGVIRFHPAKEISLEDFEKLQKRHLISEEERREWWGEAKKFFAYEFKDFVPLEEPQTIRVPRGAQTFLERLLLKGVKQPFSWWGGKNLIAKAIVSLIPDHEIYCEPFAGAAAVFFQKPRAKIEVLNDLDPEVVFLLRAIRDLSSDDFSKLKRYDWKGSRKRFEELKRKKPRTRLGKLYRFLYLNAFSYLGDPRGFSTFRIDRFRSSFDLEKIQNCSVRLKNTKILNQDYKKIVKRFDSPQTFFYFDPPYPGFFQAQWRHQFSEKDEEELLEILSKLKGKFILSYPYSKRKKLARLGFHLKGFKLTFSGAKTTERYELIVANFRLPKQRITSKQAPSALTISILGGSCEKGFPRKGCNCDQCEEARRANPYPAHTICIIEAKGFRLVIDFGKDWAGKLSEIAPTAMLLTHAHPDHIGGLRDGAAFPIYATTETLQKLRGNFEELHEIKEGKEFDLGPFRVIAHSVSHSKVAPTVCFEIWIDGRKIIYAPDVLDFKNDYLNNAEIVFCDGSSLDRMIIRKGGIGHISMKRMCELAKERNIKRVVFVHIGHVRRKFSDLNEIVKSYFPQAEIARDGWSTAFGFEKAQFLPVLSSGTKLGRRVTLNELLSYWSKDFYLSKPLVALTGGITNQPSTEGDIDVLIFLPWIDPALEFRLARALPKELATRLHFLYPLLEQGRSRFLFTSWLPVYNFRVERCQQREIIQLDAPPEERRGTTKFEKAIKPTTVFTPMKPTRAAFPNEPQSVEFLIGLLEDADFPVFVEKKLDGNHVFLHKKDDKVAIITEDGENRTARLPSIVRELEKIPHSFILDCEIDAHIQGVHYPREFVGGYLASAEPPDDSPFVANIFGILYLDGNDLTKKTEMERRSILEEKIKQFCNQSTDRIPDTKKKLNFLPSYLAENKTELRKLIAKILKLPYTEGVVVKKHSAIYYLDGDAREGWLKYHRTVLLTVIVLEQRETKVKGVFNYRIGLDPENFPIAPGDLAEAADKEWLEIATTFSTVEKYRRGDKITVEAETLNLIWNEDKKTLRITTWVTRAIGRADPEKKVDGVAQAVLRAVREKCIQVKRIYKKETYYLRPEDAQGILQAAALEKRGAILTKEAVRNWKRLKPEAYVKLRYKISAIELLGPYLENGQVAVEKLRGKFPEIGHVIYHMEDEEEQKKAISLFPEGFTVVGSHFRPGAPGEPASSSHHDFRRLLADKRFAEGVTLTDQIAGKIREVRTLLEIQAIAKRLPEYYKFHPEVSSEKKIFVLGKAGKLFGKIPSIWVFLNAGTAVPVGWPVGATAEGPGFFWADYYGMSYHGASKPYYYEMFCDFWGEAGKWDRTRPWYFRLLKTREEWTELQREASVWFLWLGLPKSIPYVFSKRNLQKKEEVFLPPKGESCLPPWIEERIPDDLRYWEKDLTLDEKYDILLEINRKIQEKTLTIFPTEKLAFAFPIEKIKVGQIVPFFLRVHSWRGQKVVRFQWRQHWDLCIWDPEEGAWREWNLIQSPLEVEETSGVGKLCSEKTPDGRDTKFWIDFEGPLPGKKAQLREGLIVGIEAVDIEDEKARWWGHWRYRVKVGKEEITSKPSFFAFKKNQKVWIDQWGNVLAGFDARGGNPNREIPAYMWILEKGKAELRKKDEGFFLFSFKDKKFKGNYVLHRTDPGSDIWVLRREKR